MNSIEKISGKFYVKKTDYNSSGIFISDRTERKQKI